MNNIYLQDTLIESMLYSGSLKKKMTQYQIHFDIFSVQNGHPDITLFLNLYIQTGDLLDGNCLPQGTVVWKIPDLWFRKRNRSHRKWNRSHRKQNRSHRKWNRSHSYEHFYWSMQNLSLPLLNTYCATVNQYRNYMNLYYVISDFFNAQYNFICSLISKSVLKWNLYCTLENLYRALENLYRATENLSSSNVNLLHSSVNLFYSKAVFSHRMQIIIKNSETLFEFC